MLKDITNTYSQTHQQEQTSETQPKENKSQSKIKSFSAEKEKKSNVSVEDEIKENYLILQQQLSKPIDSANAFLTLKNLSLLYSKGKINAQTANVNLLIDTGLLEQIIKDIESYMEMENGFDLQNAALWLIANVLALVSQEQILALIIKVPVIDSLLKFLNSDSINNVEQSLWALANLISYIEIRNIAIQKSLVEKLLSFISRMTHSYQEKLFTLKINRTLTWLVSNLCRKPSPPYLLTVHFLPYLATMIHFNDDQILRDACLALGNLVLAENNTREDDHSQIEEILSFNIGERCIGLLESQNKEVQMAALVLLGHLTYGNEKQTQRLIECGVLKGLKGILSNQEGFQRKKEALFALSNIVAGNCEQLDRVIESGLFLDVRQIITVPSQKKQLIDEGLFCIMNATYNASKKQIEILMEMKVLEILMAQYKMRQKDNDRLLDDLAEGIDNIVQMSSEIPQRIEKFLSTIGLEKILEKRQQIQEKLKQIQENQENESQENDETEEVQQQQQAAPSPPE